MALSSTSLSNGFFIGYDDYNGLYGTYDTSALLEDPSATLNMSSHTVTSMNPSLNVPLIEFLGMGPEGIKSRHETMIRLLLKWSGPVDGLAGEKLALPKNPVDLVQRGLLMPSTGGLSEEFPSSGVFGNFEYVAAAAAAAISSSSSSQILPLAFNVPAGSENPALFLTVDVVPARCKSIQEACDLRNQLHACVSCMLRERRSYERRMAAIPVKRAASVDTSSSQNLVADPENQSPDSSTTSNSRADLDVMDFVSRSMVVFGDRAQPITIRDTVMAGGRPGYETSVNFRIFCYSRHHLETAIQEGKEHLAGFKLLFRIWNWADSVLVAHGLSNRILITDDHKSRKLSTSGNAAPSGLPPSKIPRPRTRSLTVPAPPNQPTNPSPLFTDLPLISENDVSPPADGTTIPSLTFVIPDEGSMSGRQLVAISGKNFVWIKGFYFGNQEVQIVERLHENSFIIRTPPSSLSGPIPIHLITLTGDTLNTSLTFRYYQNDDFQLALQIVGMRIMGKAEDAHEVARQIIQDEEKRCEQVREGLLRFS